jgi:cytochrome c-type biogenesis protein CcmH
MLAAGLALSSAAFAGSEDHASPEPAADLGGYVEGASALEGRLLAPCCWNQTLDIHGSETANELRREIRRRLQGGESQEAIESSIVLRYGEKIRAVPPGSPLKTTAILLLGVMGVAGVGAAFMLKSWRRRSQAGRPAPASGEAKRDRYDDQIDDELDRM